MEKVIIDFDLNDEQMIREAISNYEIYEDFLVHLIKRLPDYNHREFMFKYENEFMKVNLI